MKYISTILFLFFFSCQTHKKEQSSPSIEKGSESLRNGVQNHFQTISQLLRLSEINKGVDSFEIRIWTFLIITDLRTVTILNYSNYKWDLTETRYWITEKPDNSTLKFDSSSTYEIIPKISFTEIYDSIKEFHLERLPYQADIPNFVDRTADGTDYFIEFAGRDYYKSLWYTNPHAYQDPNNKQVTLFIEFLKRNRLGVFFP
jgi:hypothetical protein